VTISVIDREAAKSGASINISWGEDDCQVNVPRGINIGIVTPPSSYLSFFSTPGVGALVIGGSLTVVLLLGKVHFLNFINRLLEVPVEEDSLGRRFSSQRA
jgi:hypothetical protein